MVAKKLDFDYSGAIKDAHDSFGHALRLRDANSQVPSGYSKVFFEKDLAGSIIEAIFYRGTTTQKTRIQFNADIAGSLNNTYFLINSTEDAVQFYYWINIDGLGTDPALPGKVGVEVDLMSNDPASIVCLAFKQLFLNCEYFSVETVGSTVLLIENVQPGQVTPAVDFNTGFGITTINTGITERACSLQLPSDPNVKYIYNYAERKFELFNTTPVTATIEGLTVAGGVVANIPAAIIGTEYSFTLTTTVRCFEMRARGSSRIQWSFSSGQSGLSFSTISPGADYKKENLVLTSPITIFFQASKANEVLEVITYS